MLPGTARAHVGDGLMHHARELTLGLGLSLGLLESLLPLIALGLALASRRPLPWLALLVSLGAGLALSGLAPENIGLPGLVVACLLAICTALTPPPLPRHLRVLATGLIPGLAMASLYHGGSATPPLAMMMGSLLGAALAVLLPALGGREILRLPGRMPVLVIRIAASWLAAILIIVLAFVLAGPGDGF